MTQRPTKLSTAAQSGTLALGAAVFALGLFAAGVYVPVAQAQDSNVKFDSAFLAKRPRPGLPDVKPQPLAWPRLDPGAVLCRSENDLDRLNARRHGETVEGQVDCQVIRDPTAIAIIQRAGPGRTEVKVTASKTADVGWTDAWLPEKAPFKGTTSASR